MTSKLKSVRAGHRSAVSRILRRIDDKLASGDKHEVDEFDIDITNLKEKQEILKELDTKILDSANEEDAEAEILDADEYKYNIDSKIHQIRKSLKVKTSLLNPTASSFLPQIKTHENIHVHVQSRTPPVTQENSIPRFSTVRSNSSTVSSEFHKLPKLHLPRFDGNLLDWQSFWDSFDSAVHGNSTLSDVQKFNYLKTLLEGEAAITIAGFALTNTNYQRAVELLHERFGQTHKIRQSYMQQLLELPAPKCTLNSLKWYYDTVETYIRGLESLGQTQESYGSLLVSVILNKLPSEICQNLTREHGTTDLTLEESRRSIFKELRILESGHRVVSTTETPQVTATFYTNTKSLRTLPRGNAPKSCAYCKGQHYSGECTKHADYEARIKIVKRDKLCFNCLGKHAVADCKSKSNCKKCSKRHHTSLCNTESSNGKRSADQESTSTQENRETTKESTRTYTVQGNDNANSVICSSLNVRQRPNVLLKTAVAPVTFGDVTVDANILFDEGSQRSFVTQSLADKLDLQPNGREAITLSGFGDDGKNGKIQHIETAKIRLETLDGKGIMLDVLIVPQIAAPIRTYVQTTQSYPYLRNLKLAHSVTDDDCFEIGLLIGVDQYWSIVEDEVRRGDGPTAVKSKIGYLLSGPCTATRKNITTSMMNIIASHVREEVDLEKFWRVENIGTESEKEKPWSRQEFQNQYEESSIRILENRYIAKLHWKKDHPELPTNLDKSVDNQILTTISETANTPCHTFDQDLHVQERKISKVMAISHYNSLNKLLHVTAYVMRFIKNCKTKKRSTGPLSVYEIENASLKWIADCQHNKFADISSDLQRNSKPRHCLSKQLKLYIDDKGLIRCKGRIHNAPIDVMAKFPILLPTNDELTNLIIQDAHRRSFHSGSNSTVTLLRQVYWIPQIRQVVKTVLRKCITCKKLSGLPYCKPEPPPLPPDRVRLSAPFTVTGVDFTGVLHVREANGKIGKAYICLFTCASTRAIHLELVSSLSEEQFLLAFRRFASRRSVPKVMISDNAAQFSSSAKEIERLTSSKTIQETLQVQGTAWNFIPKGAPWFGGFWERLIGITKTCVRKVLGRSLVSFDVLRTVLTEVECILNDRPLTYISTDPLDEEPLTPSHLMYGRKIVTLPYPSDRLQNDNYKYVNDISHASSNEMLKIQNQLIEHFRRRWKCEYLTSLREYHRFHGNNEQKIRIGDIVQIHDDTPRLQWKLGMVEQVNTGIDGLIRSVTLRTRNGLTSRPISKLYPLELNANDAVPVPNDTNKRTERAAKQKALDRIREWKSGSQNKK